MFQWYRLFLLLGIIAALTNAWTITTTIHHAERQRTTATHLHGQSKLQEEVENHGSNNNRLLIVGFGRVGQQVARLASKQVAPKEEDSLYWNQIVGTVRDGEKAANVNDDDESSISCIPISQLQQELSSNYTHVLIAMPPNDEIYTTILCGIQNITWLGMVSTTGVYGNHDGGWVTEESALRCSETSTASQYVEWEDTFGQAKCQPMRIFRCAGIYDGTRSALHTLWKQAAKQGELSKSNNRVEFKTNRIHVEDIAQAIVHSMIETDSKSSFEIYNLADDLPERRSVVMEYAASLLTKKLGEDWKSKSAGSEKAMNAKNNSNDNTTTKRETKSVRRRRRELEPKMIDNQKLKSTLLPQLKYPSYKEGLEAILLEPQAPWNNLKED